MYIFFKPTTNIVPTFKVFGFSMEERVLMQEFLTSKLLFKILPKYSILSFRADKLDTTCANSNASKQIIYLKCIIWWKCPKLSHKEIETDLSFWKRSLRLREKFCKNQLPIYHTSQKSFSHNIYQPLSLSSGKFLFFCTSRPIRPFEKYFFTSFKLRHLSSKWSILPGGISIIFTKCLFEK